MSNEAISSRDDRAVAPLEPETLTVGRLLKEMRPSQLWTLAIAVVGLVVGAYQLGSWVSSTLLAHQQALASTSNPDAPAEELAAPASPAPLLHASAEAENAALGIVESLTQQMTAQAERSEKEGDAWLLGQLLICGADRVHVGALLDRLARQMDPNCGCWKRLPGQNNTVFHNVASSWALIGMTFHRDARSAPGIRYLLSDQANDGSWSLYPRKMHEYVRPSTYATTLALLALSYFSDLQVAADPRESEVQAAISRGMRWLLDKEENGIWKDYPNQDTGTRSHAISSLVLHVLHRLGEREVGTRPRVPLRELDRRWVEQLPAEIVTSVDLEERSETWVAPALPDDVFQAPAAWTLVGARDAYANATDKQKLRLTRWVSDVFERSEFPQQVMVLEWRVCEFLMATQYAIGRRSF